jgi:hypothetical protein
VRGPEGEASGDQRERGERRDPERQARERERAAGEAGGGAEDAAGRALRGLLFEVPGHDPLTFVLSALVLAGVALLASDGPARRASRLDPLRALRTDGPRLDPGRSPGPRLPAVFRPDGVNTFEVTSLGERSPHE